MAIDIFVSRPTWISPNIDIHMQEFYNAMSQVGLNPRTIGTNIVPMSSPFEEIKILMEKCKGTIILGVPQIVVQSAEIKGVAVNNIVLPTEWNHIEATMSLMMGIPTLVLLHENVMPRGIFDRGAANVFIHPFNAQASGWVLNIIPALNALKQRC